MNKRTVGIAAVFGLGLVLGCAVAPLVVPKASAQQAATLTKWEYTCFDEASREAVVSKSGRLGAEGWEMAGVDSSASYTIWCFKRPKL